MKTHYYYLGQLARLCEDATKDKANKNLSRQIRYKALLNPKECLELCETFKPNLNESQLAAFETIRRNYLLVAIAHPLDMYQISNEEKKQNFSDGYNFKMPGRVLLGSLLIWMICAVGIFLGSQYYNDQFYRKPFAYALSNGQQTMAKAILMVSLNPKKTISSIPEVCQLDDMGLMKKMFALGYKPHPNQIVAWYNSPEILKFYLQNGGDINVFDKSGVPVLFRVPDIKTLNLIVQEGKPDFTLRCSDGTGTNIAFHARSAEMLHWFAEHGVDMDCKDNEGRGIFEFYFNQQDVNILQFFADRKYDFNQKLSNGKSCVFYLVDPDQNYNPELLKFVIEHGANVNEINEYGETPLMLADSVEKSLCLIEHGADVNAKDADGRTPIMLVDSFEKFSCLIEHGADVNAKDKWEQTPLMLADSFEKFSCLVEHSADVNAKDAEGRTPIMLVSSFAKFSLLIKHGANVNVKDKEGNTLLHLADSPEKKKLLLEKGVDFMAENDEGLTPLEYQLQGCIELRDKAAALEEDLSKRIDEYNREVDEFNSQPHPTQTPPRLGQYNDSDFFRRLVEQRTQNSIENQLLSKKRAIEADQKNIADMTAQLQAYVENINFYIEQKCDVAAVFQKMLAKRQDEYIPIFCASNLDLKALGYEGKTFLQGLVEKMEKEVNEMMAETEGKIQATASESEQNKIYLAAIKKRTVIEKYYIETIAKLVERGADVNQKNSEGFALLHISIQHYLPLITRAVLELGADFDIQDPEGNTPLHIASSQTLISLVTSESTGVTTRSSVCDLETMRTLIDKGAKIDAQNSAGETPLHLAARNDCVESMELLLDEAEKQKGEKKSLEIKNENGYSPMYLIHSLKAFNLLNDAGFSYKKKLQDGMNLLKNAVLGDDIKLFKVLQNKGLKMKTSNTGENLMFFVRSPEMIRFLQNEGVEVNTKNEAGKNPMNFVANWFLINIFLGNPSEVEFLREKGTLTCELLYELGCNSEEDKKHLESLKTGVITEALDTSVETEEETDEEEAEEDAEETSELTE